MLNLTDENFDLEKMNKVLLKIEKLRVKSDEKEILKGVNLNIKAGQIQALLGPNGSGKTVFCQAILGNPKYKIIQGKIFFEGKEINKFPSEKRVKLGIALAWQAPPTIKGVKLSQLLKRFSQKTIEIEEGKDLLEREVNVGFSGGEKKISELIQVLNLCPKLVIFDEIDSGLDIKRLEKVAELIKRKLVSKKVSILLITHWGQILNYLEPDWTSVMLDGKIICQEKDFKKVLKIIKRYDYEKCKRCPLLSD